MPLNIILILFLLACSSFFSCSETALFSLSRGQLQRLKESRGVFAKQVIHALSRPRELLVAILLGNELVNVAIAILIAAAVYEIMAGVAWQVSVLTAVAISTPLIVVLGEVIPKNFGIRSAARLAPILVVPLRLFTTATKPIHVILMWFADHAIRIFKGDPREVRSLIMEEEFRRLVDLSLESGAMRKGEGILIHRMFDMADISVDKIMTPQERLFALPLEARLDDAMLEIRATQFSRIPVYMSDPNDIVGVLYIRDIFPALRRHRVEKLKDLENLIRPAYFVPNTMKLEELLREFQTRKVHMAIVVDDLRRPVGIVTMDDVFGALIAG